ncbi:MAG: Smr/MutS family protein [Bauldia sp.]
MSRRRVPTGEELELWEKVKETVAPIAPVKAPPKPPEAEKKRPPGPQKKKAPPAPQFVPPKPPPPKAPPALAPLDRRTRSRVARGAVAIDRRIDLHGLTQLAAERRLETFLRDAQMEGAKVVLVITGKGKAADDAREGERGILRRMVPHWLASPALRPVVIGFEEAARNHGGAGALYVRIRRVK